MKFLVIGHPRCGTGFSAKVFQALGYKVGHEIPGEDGVSSWVYAVPDATLFDWIRYPRQHYMFDTVFVCIRDPYTAIPSIAITEVTIHKSEPTDWATRNTWLSTQFRREVLNLPSDLNFYEEGARSYIGWYEMVFSEFPNARVFRIEHLEDLREYYSPELESLGSNTNKRDYVVDDLDWRALTPTTITKLDEICNKVGYTTLSSRIKRFIQQNLNILVFGGRGWIGQKLCKRFEYEEMNYILAKSRADDEKAVISEIQNTKPTHVISLIGRVRGEDTNNVDYLEDHLEENIRDNLFGVLVLAQVCQLFNIHYTYVGTGCLSGSSAYSIVKRYTDRMMELYKNSLNLRIRLPISSELSEVPRDFIEKILQYPKICSMENSMTVLDDFLLVFTDLIRKSKKGTYNCFNPGSTNHNWILAQYKKLYNPDHEWSNITEEELPSSRSNTVFRPDEKLSGYYLPVVQESILRVMKMKFLEQNL